MFSYGACVGSCRGREDFVGGKEGFCMDGGRVLKEGGRDFVWEEGFMLVGRRGIV